MEGKALDGKSNHFIAAAEELSENELAFAYLDVSTGEANTSIIEGSAKELVQQLQAYAIKEVIVTDQLKLLLADYAETSGIVLSLEKEEMDSLRADNYVAALL